MSLVAQVMQLPPVWEGVWADNRLWPEVDERDCEC